ncbi:hypothetical protein, partial [Archangium sp.]|uniref:hypothetical protein n=1 Tax=Archangium sp. TaxID=1872627 RepID=UPI002EDAC1F3
MVPAWGRTAEPVAVTIEGENFLALATQHIGGPEPLSVDARFEAFLGEVALEDVTLEDARTLRARVPVGLGPGWHTLSLVGPLGQHAELPRAYFASERPLATLQARAALERAQVLVGERTRLVLTVENVGSTSALGVTPVLSQVGEGRAEVVSEPGPADILAGESTLFTWELGTTAPGEVRFSLEAWGRESELGAELGVSGVEAGPLRIRPTPGLLTARFLLLPERINLGQQFDIELEVTNPGGSPVLGVKLEAATSVGTGQVTLVSGPEPASVDIAAGGRGVFRARVIGTGEGSCSFRAGVRGLDQTYGAPVVVPPITSSTVSVQRPATLTGVLAAPSHVRPGSLFDVVLTVTNTGSATARDVLPTVPSVSSGVAEPATVPSPSPVELAGGASTTYTWSYRAVSQGKVSFTTSTSGTDGNARTPVSSGTVSSGEVSVFELELMRTDPFKDGSAFAQIFPYGDRLVLGPNRSGTKAVRVDPAGTADSELSFSFPKDTSGNSSQNASAPRYSSIGATGCTPNTASCGPDNEDGRGFFFAGRMGTQEWLGIGGARSGGDL